MLLRVLAVNVNVSCGSQWVSDMVSRRLYHDLADRGGLARQQ